MSDKPNVRVPELLAARLRARILGNKQMLGEKMPSARRLAAEFGVSVSTLRAAQAILMHEGLLVGHPRSGVRVSQSGTRLRVGILSELNVLAPDGGYHRDLADQTMQEVRARGMAATIYCGTVQQGEVIDTITCPEFWDAVEHNRLVAAIILTAPSTSEWFYRFNALSLPVVGAPTPFSADNNELSMIVAGVHELRRQGVTRVAMLSWNRKITGPVFEKATAELGMSSRPHWIGGEFHPELSGSGWEAFRDIWAAYPDKPDGLLVTNDALFKNAAMAIMELGIHVPEQLKIVCHANRSSEPFSVPFPHTRCEFDPHDNARILVDLLERRLAGGVPPDKPIQTPFVLIEVGKSVATQRRTAGSPSEQLVNA